MSNIDNAAANINASAATIATVSGNKEQRKAQLEEAQRQREWNLKMWNLANEYNTPESQMQRYKDANLNPHLIYGQGTPGNAGDVKGYTQPEMKNLLEGVDQFRMMYDFKNTAAQTDNLRAQNQVIKQQAANVAVDTALKQVGINQKMFDLGLAKDMRDSSLEAARANANKATSEAARSLTESQVAEMTKDARVRRALIETQTAYQTYKGKELENAIKSIDLRLSRALGTKRSGFIMGVLEAIVQGGFNVSEYIQGQQDKPLPKYFE